MKVLKIGIFGRFLTEWKMHYLAIFFTKWHFNWDALLTCQRWTCFLQPPFFPRALKMVKFKGFRPATIWRGAAFHFLAVFSKKEILWKLWLWFSKMFHQRVFPDWKWSLSKFQVLRQIRRRANSIPWCIFPEASRNIEIRSFSRRLFSHFCSSKSKKIALFCYFVVKKRLLNLVLSLFRNKSTK